MVEKTTSQVGFSTNGAGREGRGTTTDAAGGRGTWPRARE
jgi:hypothetical protein